MSGETGYRFLCPGCGASFGWKPQYAGRKIRCKCGQVFMPPDPAGATAEEPDPYAMSDDAPPAPRFAAHGHAAHDHAAHGHAAPRRVAVAPPPEQALDDAAPVVASAPNSLAGVAALYPGRRARPVTEEADRGASALRDLYLPIALIVLGLGLRVAQLLVANENRAHKWGGNVSTPDDPGKAVLLAAFQMVIAGGVMIAGATLAATVLNLNFGSMGRAALKLCAISVFATGVASWVAVFDQGKHSVEGLALALHIVVILYWVGFMYFFALDVQETLLAVAIITLLHAAATCALWKA